MLTGSQKKYLFAIYKLGMSGKSIRSTEIAKIVGVSKASTATMTQKLCESGYVLKQPYGKISLTEEGNQEAALLYYKCSVLQRFLEDNVGIPEADGEAMEILSHISDDSAEKLTSYLLERTSA